MAELIKPGYNDTADIADINSNTDEFAARIANCKTKQTAKTDPSADGTAVSFIDSVTQNANGEVTATKKTVKNMTGSTASAAGAAGLAPAPSAGDQGKFLQGNGTWGTPANTTYGEASSSAYGLVKIGYTASGKNYPVQLSSGKMFVNVPWTDNNTTYSQATSSALGLVKIGFTASGKNYPVQLDSSGRMYVNVPWTDNNTTYGEASSSTYGLIKTGYTANGKNYPVQLSSGKAYVNVPWTDNNTTYSNFGGTTGSGSGTSGLVPAPTAEYRYATLIGEGHWCSLQDVLNVTQAKAFSSIQSTAQKLEFRLGDCNNVAAINGEVTVNFSPAFSTGCHIVIPILRSNLNGVYNRFCCYDWGKTGFKYKAQNGSNANISFTWFAIGY